MANIQAAQWELSDWDCQDDTMTPGGQSMIGIEVDTTLVAKQASSSHGTAPIEHDTSIRDIRWWKKVDSIFFA